MASKVLNETQVKILMESILKDERVTNVNFDITGNTKGDGYISFMTQVDVKETNLNVIIKSAPKSETFRQFAPVHNMFLREIYFYEKLMPEFLKFQQIRNVKKPFNSIAKFYKSGTEEFNEFLIMENLRGKNFRHWNRKVPMDKAHLEHVFHEYGKLHAISYAIKDQEPELYGSLVSDLSNVFTAENSKEDDFIKQIIILLNNLSDKFSEKVEIKKKLTKFTNELFDFLAVLGEEKGKRSVIVHGDCWCNNMMFKYEDPLKPTLPTSICLLDFQICHISSPVTDLSYAFYVSADKTAMERLEDYLKVYHRSLSNHLVEMGSDPEECLPYVALEEEWRKYARFGFMMTVAMLRLMLRDDEEMVDLNDIDENGFNMSDVYSTSLKNNQDLLDQRLIDIVMHMTQNKYL